MFDKPVRRLSQTVSNSCPYMDFAHIFNENSAPGCAKAVIFPENKVVQYCNKISKHFVF
jgi:hypothetical protein